MGHEGKLIFSRSGCLLHLKQVSYEEFVKAFRVARHPLEEQLVVHSDLSTNQEPVLVS
jgi:hypothetical protein